MAQADSASSPAKATVINKHAPRLASRSREGFGPSAFELFAVIFIFRGCQFHGLGRWGVVLGCSTALLRQCSGSARQALTGLPLSRHQQLALVYPALPVLQTALRVHPYLRLIALAVLLARR